MAKARSDQPLVPSVLDRLLDEDPGTSRDAPRTRFQVLRELKQSVRRDIENLLNTRCRAVPFPGNLTDLEVSVVNYGLPDFIGANMGAAEMREQFCQVIEKVIRTYEPRFKSVQVKQLGNADESDRTLRFRIDALLYADPAPEPVTFDSAVEPGTGSFEVKGVG